MSHRTRFSFSPETIRRLSSNFDIHHAQTTESDSNTPPHINPKKGISDSTNGSTAITLKDRVNVSMMNEPKQILTQTQELDDDREEEMKVNQSTNVSDIDDTKPRYPSTDSISMHRSPYSSRDDIVMLFNKKNHKLYGVQMKADGSSAELIQETNASNDHSFEWIIMNDIKITGNVMVLQSAKYYSYYYLYHYDTDYKANIQFHKANSDDLVSVCKYHGSMIGCRKGSKCAYNHSNPKSVPLCRHRHNCRYQTECRFRHF